MPREKKTTNLPKKAEDKGLTSNKEYESTLAELKALTKSGMSVADAIRQQMESRKRATGKPKS